ncbi:hypothetical protein B0H10DRAFT_2197884 [Mycena sp. CBHHK59/15]|nr:hypothetical protein B0H10DRAFT_2197884 [Mycena sp. CBHHK59/15]
MTILGKGRVGKSRLGRTVGRRAVVEEGQHRRGRDVVGVGRRVTWAVAPAWWKVVGGGAAGQLGECNRDKCEEQPKQRATSNRSRVTSAQDITWESRVVARPDAFLGCIAHGSTRTMRIIGDLNACLTFWFFLSLAPNSKCSICGSTSETRCWIMNSTRSSWEVLMGPTAGTHAQGRLSVSVVQFVTPLSDDDSDYPRQTIDLSAPVAS